MKKMMMAAVALICMMMCVSLAACSSSDDNNDSPADTQVVTLSYSAEVGSAFLDFFDVYMIYTDAAGVVQKKAFTTTKCSYSDVVTYDKAPKDYKFSVVAYPKESHPVVDESRTDYDVSHSYNVTVGVKASASATGMTQIIILQSYSSGSRKTSGKRIQEYLGKTEHVIATELTGTK